MLEEREKQLPFLSDPWGTENIKELIERHSGSLAFEDSFCSSDNSTVLPQAAVSETSYVPLDDSKQYLAGLESKLALLQGKTYSKRASERRCLIDALALSKDCQNANLLQSQEGLHSDSSYFVDGEDRNSDNKAVVDPQGALGTVVRRLAPGKVALSEEELCALLKADILGQCHEQLNSESFTRDPKEDAGADQPCPAESADANS